MFQKATPVAVMDLNAGWITFDLFLICLQDIVQKRDNTGPRGLLKDQGAKFLPHFVNVIFRTGNQILHVKAVAGVLRKRFSDSLYNQLLTSVVGLDHALVLDDISFLNLLFKYLDVLPHFAFYSTGTVPEHQAQVRLPVLLQADLLFANLTVGSNGLTLLQGLDEFHGLSAR